MKRIKVRALEGLSLFVVRLHVKGRFPVEYLSSRNVISDFDIFTAGHGLSKTTIWILSDSLRFLLGTNFSPRKVA